MKTASKEVQPLPLQVKELIITTDDKKRLQCFYIDNEKSRKVILYFHGNAGNIYQRVPELLKLSSFNCDVIGAGYRGYGKSTGHPSEKGSYRDGNAVFNYAVHKLSYAYDSIFIIGRSIGTTVAVNTSMNKAIGGVVLITPLT